MDSSSTSETDSKNQTSSILSTPPRNVACSSLATNSTTLTIPLDSMDLSNNTTTTAGNNLLFSSAKATPMTPSTPSSSHPVKTLYLSNLPQDVKEREMYLLCRSLDGYDGFVLKPPPTSHHGMSAFIAFTSAELAQVGYMKLHDFIKDETCPVEWKQVKIDFAKSDTRHHSHHPSTSHHQQSSSKRARSVDMYTSSPYNGNSYYYGANTSSDSVSSQPSSPNHSFTAPSTVSLNTSQTSGGSPRHQQQHSPPHQPSSAPQQPQQQPPSTPPQSMKSEKRIKYNNYYASPSGQTNHAWNDSQNENSSNFDNNQMLLNTLLSIYNTQQTQQPPQQANTPNSNNNQLLVNLMSLVSNQLSANNNSAPSTPSGSATSTPFKSSTARDVSVGSNHGALFSPTTTSQAATVLFSPNAPTTSASQNTNNNFQHLRVVTSSTSTPMRPTASTNTGTNANETNSNSANVLHSFQSSTPSTPHHSHSAHMGLGSVSTPSNTHSGFNVLTPSSNLTAQNTLFVANLPQECSDLDLHGFFSQFYGFVRCKRGHKPFLCFVEFQDSFSAQQAKEVLHHFHLRYVLYNSPNANSPMIHFVSMPTITNKSLIQEGDDDGLPQQPQSLDDKANAEEIFEKDKILEKVLRCEFAKNRMK